MVTAVRARCGSLWPDEIGGELAGARPIEGAARDAQADRREALRQASVMKLEAFAARAPGVSSMKAVRMLRCAAVAVGLMVLAASSAIAASCVPTTPPNTAGVTANSQLEVHEALCSGMLGGTALGYQQITSLSASTALTVPNGATMALICVEASSVRWRDDLTAPTASVGMPVSFDQCFQYSVSLANIRFIQQAPGAVLNVNYYR